LGDDGRTQAVIRTMSGWGYRWIPPVMEDAGPAALSPAQTYPAPTNAEPMPSLQTAATQIDAAGDGVPPQMAEPLPSEPSRSTEPDRRTQAPQRRGMVIAAAALMSVAAMGAAYNYVAPNRAIPGAGSPSDDIVTSDKPIDGLRKALHMGRYEDVREGLLRLPAVLVDTPDARMLEIELDIERGLFDRAREKLAVQQPRAKSAAEPIWQAKPLILQSESHIKAADAASEALPPAQLAVEMLASAGTKADAETLGSALSARGSGFLIANDLEPAMQDLVRAQELLQTAGDERGAALARRYLAHVWLRMGRMTDAREQMVAVADTFRKLNDPVNEIGARNMATRIQIEQLRWDEALVGSERNLQVSKQVPETRRRTGALLLRGLALMGVGRLREAASFVDEADAVYSTHTSLPISTTHALASGRPEQALAMAATAFQRYDDSSRLNLNLENREGILLLWMIAAQSLVARGESMPEPSAAQLSALQAPESNIGRVARGRWLWSQGKPQAAEAEFRSALTQPTAPGWLSETLYAKEALIELLLERGDITEAQRALTDMRGYDPARFARDYRANLLALRVALASGNQVMIESSYDATRALAGERALPMAVLEAYAQRGSGPPAASLAKESMVANMP
jgi:tetratricopeptide (TPR) repeat protein